MGEGLKLKRARVGIHAPVEAMVARAARRVCIVHVHGPSMGHGDHDDDDDDDDDDGSRYFVGQPGPVPTAHSVCLGGGDALRCH